MNASAPYHRTAKLISGDRVLVTEMQGSTVIRSYDRDLRTFGGEQQHRLGVAAVTCSGITLP